MLALQYRMHPAIRAFPSKHFYHDQLLDAKVYPWSPSLYPWSSFAYPSNPVAYPSSPFSYPWISFSYPWIPFPYPWSPSLPLEPFFEAFPSKHLYHDQPLDAHLYPWSPFYPSSSFLHPWSTFHPWSHFSILGALRS